MSRVENRGGIHAYRYCVWGCAAGGVEDVLFCESWKQDVPTRKETKYTQTHALYIILLT